MSEAHAQIRAARGRGSFITLEGGEGAGKSTQIGHLLRNLREAGIKAIGTREPGGSPGAEMLRKVLLSGKVAIEPGQNVVAVVSGGNVAPQQAAAILASR